MEQPVTFHCPNKFNINLQRMKIKPCIEFDDTRSIRGSRSTAYIEFRWSLKEEEARARQKLAEKRRFRYDLDAKHMWLEQDCWAVAATTDRLIPPIVRLLNDSNFVALASFARETGARFYEMMCNFGVFRGGIEHMLRIL